MMYYTLMVYEYDYTWIHDILHTYNFLILLE